MGAVKERGTNRQAAARLSSRARGDYEVPLSDVGDADRSGRAVWSCSASPLRTAGCGSRTEASARALVRGGKHGRPVRLGQHVLNHEGVHVNHRCLHDVQRQHAEPPRRRTPSCSATRWARPGASSSSRTRSPAAKADRPGLAAALEYLRRGDTLVVWKLDRLGRSVKEALTIADELHEHRIGLRILTGTLAGTYTPTGEGKFFFTIMAAFAELERDMIHQRTMAGLAARAQGRVGGRPSVMDADKLAAATARLARGESPAQIAKALGVSRATLYRHTDVVTARGQS